MTGKQSYQAVEELYVREADELLTIVTSDGRSIETTPEHPFWVVKRCFVEAGRRAPQYGYDRLRGRKDGIPCDL